MFIIIHIFIIISENRFTMLYKLYSLIQLLVSHYIPVYS